MFPTYQICYCQQNNCFVFRIAKAQYQHYTVIVNFESKFYTFLVKCIIATMCAKNSKNLFKFVRL